MPVTFDQDALVAGVELVGRTGAKFFEVGYHPVYDHAGVEIDEPPEDATKWWAKAQYQGAMVAVDDHPGPVEAVEALARRLFAGALCGRCGLHIRLDDGPGCRWTRTGPRWLSGCDAAAQLAELTMPVHVKATTAAGVILFQGRCSSHHQLMAQLASWNRRGVHEIAALDACDRIVVLRPDPLIPGHATETL